MALTPALTRIKNNQITDNTIIASSKIVPRTVTGGLLSDPLMYSGNVSITGNLTVAGTTTTIDTVNSVVADPLVVLNRNAAGSNTYDIGFVFERGADINTAFIWDEANEQFALLSTTEVGTTQGSINNSGYLDLHIANLIASGTSSTFGNIQIGQNTISSVNTNGNINLTPNGTGEVVAATLSVTDLTSGRVALIGSNGSLVDDTGITYSGNSITLGGNLAVNGGEITTTQTTANVFAANATTINMGAANGNVIFGGDIQIGGDSIRESGGNVAIQLTNTNVEVAGDLAVNGGDITTTQTTANVFAANATTINIGASGGNVITGGDLQLGGNDIRESGGNVAITLTNTNVEVIGDLAVTGGDITTSAATATVFNANVTTLSVGNAATTLYIGNSSGNVITGGDLQLGGNDIRESGGNVAITLSNTNVEVAGDLAVGGGDITTDEATATIFNANATTLSVGNAATTLYIGNSSGNVITGGDLQLGGNDIRESGGNIAIALTNTNVEVVGDLAITGGDITTTAATATIFNANATTLSIGNAATTLYLGDSTGNVVTNGDLQITGNDIRSSTGNVAITLNDKDANIAGNLNVADDLAVNGGDITTTQTTANIFVANATTLNIGNAATATYIGNSSGNVTVAGDIIVGGNDIRESGGNVAISLNNLDVSVAGDLAVNGGDITTDETTATIFNANVTTLSIGNAATTTYIGNSAGNVIVGNDLQVMGGDIRSPSGTVALTLNGADVTIPGNLTVQGTQTNIGTQDLVVNDALIRLHTTANLEPLVGDDGRDVGIVFHYYKTSNKEAGLVWANDTGALEYYSDAVESNTGVFSGQYGTIKANLYWSEVPTGTAPFQVQSTTQVANLNVAVAGNLVNGNSNVLVYANSNVAISANGVANVAVISYQGANITGWANVSGNIDTANNINTTNATVNIANANTTTLYIGGAATTTYLGASGGNVNIGGDVILGGNDIRESGGNVAISLNNLDVTVAGDLAVNGGDITTDETTATIFNANVTTLSVGNAATTTYVGASGGNVITGGDLQLGGNDIRESGGNVAITLNNTNVEVVSDLAVNGGDITTTQTTATLFNANATTLSVGNAATTLYIGNSSGNVITGGDLQLGGNDIRESGGNVAITLNNLDVTVAGDLAVNGGDITTDDTTATIFNANVTTLSVGNAATTTYVGAANGNVIFGGDIQLSGDSIRESGGNVAIQLTNTDVEVVGDLAVNGGDITTDDTTATIFNANVTTLSIGNAATTTYIGNALGNVITGGDLQLGGNDIRESGGNVAITLSNTNVEVAGDLLVSGGDITTDEATATIFNANVTSLSIGNAATGVFIGNTSGTGTTQITGNLTVTTNIDVFGNADLANLRVQDTTISSVTTNANINIDPNGTGAIVLNSTGDDSNVVIKGNTASGYDNLIYADAVNGRVGILTDTIPADVALKINANNSVILPVGNTATRPSTEVEGMLRYNTTISNYEFWDGAAWQSTGSSFTIISTDAFSGDGSTVAFTLSQNTTTAGVIIAINGIVQQPTTAYNVTGNTVTFTEAPLAGDEIDARVITTTSTVEEIAQGDSAVSIVDTGSNGTVTLTADGTARLVANTAVNIDGPLVPITSGTSVGLSATVIDSFDKTIYRSAKYVIQVSHASAGYEVSEVLVVHNGTTATQSQYGVTFTTASLGATSVSVNGNNIELKYTGVNSANTVKIFKEYIRV